MKKPFLIFLFSLFFNSCFGQYQPVLQYQNIPLSLNPALAGLESKPRINLYSQILRKHYIYDNSYHGQSSFSFDNGRAFGKKSNIGTGILVNINRNGSRSMQSNEYYVMMTYQYRIAETAKRIHLLSGGISLGHIRESYPLFSDETRATLDLGFGIVYKNTSKQKRASFEVGYSRDHISRHAWFFTPRTYLFLSDQIYASANFRIRPRWSLVPRYYRYTITNRRLVQLDLAVKYQLFKDKEHSLELGIGDRQTRGWAYREGSFRSFYLGYIFPKFSIHAGITGVYRISYVNLNVSYLFVK